MGGNGLTAPGIPHRAHHCHGCREHRKGGREGRCRRAGCSPDRNIYPCLHTEGNARIRSVLHIHKCCSGCPGFRPCGGQHRPVPGRTHPQPEGSSKIRWVSHTSGHTGIRIRSRRGFLRARQAGCLWPRLRGRDRLRRNGPTGRTGVCVRSIFQDDLCNG